MERLPYPVESNGRPVSVHELGLAPSELDPSQSFNWNNHHYYYYSGLFKRALILTTLRDLEGSQVEMLKDQHMEQLRPEALHAIYSGVKVPTPRQAMDLVAEGIDRGERLKVYDKDQKKYVFNPVTEIHLKQLYLEYNRTGGDVWIGG